MRKLRLITVGVVTLWSTAIFAGDQPANKAGAPTRPAVAANPNRSGEKFPIIGYIEKRDRTIAIHSGPKGTVYTVKNAKGEVLFDKVSASELRAKAPEIHQFIKTATANLDASLR